MPNDINIKQHKTMEVQETIEDIIRNGKYRDPAFNEQEANQVQIQKWMEKTPNTPQKLAAVIELIKFYGLPFLFQCRTIYHHLTQAERKNAERELQAIMILAKWILGTDHPPQLKFLVTNIPGIKRKIEQPTRQPPAREQEFILYWREVRSRIERIENFTKSNLVGRERQINRFFEEIICSDKLRLNYFETQVNEFYIQQVYEDFTVLRHEESLKEKDQQKEAQNSGSDEEEQNEQPKEQEPGKKKKKKNRKKNKKEPEVQIPKKQLPKEAPKELPKQLPKEPPKAPPKQSPIKEAPRQRRISDGRTPICCRKYFQKGQVLQESESLTLEFKNYREFWDPYPHHFNILKTINGFLNRDGGILLIGVEEDLDTKRPTVRGTSIYNEKRRQQINQEIVYLCKKIYPDIISTPKLQVHFVPVLMKNTKQYIPGAFVIRIKIACGQRDSVYFFNWNNEDIFSFRQEKEVIIRPTRMALEEQKNRGRRPLEMPPKLHEGACLLPDHGRPIYGNTAAKAREDYQDNRNWRREPSGQRSGEDQRVRDPQRNNGPPDSNKDVGRREVREVRYVEVDPKQSQTQIIIINAPFYIYLPQGIEDMSKGTQALSQILMRGIDKDKCKTAIVNYQPGIIPMQLDRSSLKLLKENIEKLKGQEPQAKSMAIVAVTRSLYFADDKTDEKLDEAIRFLASGSKPKIYPDKPQRCINFSTEDDALQGYFRLMKKGMNPRFLDK